MPAHRVVTRHGDKVSAVAARSHESRTKFETLARDHTLWVDTCGKSFYVEQASPVTAQGSTAQGSTTPTSTVASSSAVTDAFSLQSKPGAPRTIYLDFAGGTISGTSWNDTYNGGSPIVVEPYTIDSDPTTFTTTELAQITQAWQVVSADYAPFDVNVTTKDPGSSAIDRTDSSDQTYGTTVMISNDNPIYLSCGCGGVAYIDVFNLTGSYHAYYQPAWVFLSGVGTGGKNIGEAAAHEAGHNFGLHHDGTSTSGYYAGAKPWAPIMGASYYEPVSQWSMGEYPGANNQEDDLAIIASGAPLMPDDYGDTAATAQPLGSTPLQGLISTRTDVDAFSFRAAGDTTLSVSVAPFMSDLDVGLTIKDASGATVAHVDPPVSYVSQSSASGLDATWTATLPAGGGSYTAFVDGVGAGDPTVAGGYSDYASLGAYTISLSTQAPSLQATAATLPDGQKGTAYDNATGTVSGGTAPYSFAATGVPAGMSVDASTGHLTGTPTVAGDFSVQVTATDASGVTATFTDPFHVVDGAYPPVQVTGETFTLVSGLASVKSLSASGGDGVYAWSADSPLPDGLTLNSDGTLSGTPATTGSYSFDVSATSAGMTGRSTMSVTVDPLLRFRTAGLLPRARKGHFYRAVIRTAGAAPAFTWHKVRGNPPRGVRLRFRGSRVVVVGTPKQVGRFGFRLRVESADGQVLAKAFRLRVRR